MILELKIAAYRLGAVPSASYQSFIGKKAGLSQPSGDLFSTQLAGSVTAHPGPSHMIPDTRLTCRVLSPGRERSSCPPLLAPFRHGPSPVVNRARNV